MARGPLDTLVRRLHRLLPPPAAGVPTDAQLLDRFVHGHDEAAFEVLVWRHGVMVLNVCRRLLPREHDVEDAFQATFLALVRKAGAIGKGASVGSWLYKVAYRVALRARSTLPTRSPAAEPRDGHAEEPLAGLLRREILSAVDEEVQRLPEKYRAAFVLCHLEGQTLEAAARTLGCPTGTVGTRLARARERLRCRLARRGFTLATLAAVRQGRTMAAAVVDSTLAAVRFGTADKAAAAGVISARAAALTRGVLRTMSLTKWALATAVVLPLALLGAAIGHHVRASDPVRAARAASCPTARESDAGVLLRWRLEEGRTFYQEMTTDTTQQMKVLNNDVTQTQNQTFLYRWTPRKVGGQWALKQKIEGVKVNVDIGGSKIEYDSAKGAAANNPLAGFYKSLVGAEFTLTLDRKNRLKRIDGRDAFLEKVAASNPQARPLAAKVVADEALRQTVEPIFTALPAKRVRPGDSWTRTSTVDRGPVGTYRVTRRYTYEGRQGRLDRIRMKAIQHTYVPPDKKKDYALPFRIKKVDLKLTGGGVILFDRPCGRITRMELNEKLEGTMCIAIGGEATEVKLSLTQRTRFQTTDANPLAPARGKGRKEIERLREENERLKRRLRAVEDALRREGKPDE